MPMESIEVRDVPDDVHAALARFARVSGQSVEEYVRDWLIALTREPDSPAEALEHMEAVLTASSSPGATRESVLAALDADRR